MSDAYDNLAAIMKGNVRSSEVNTAIAGALSEITELRAQVSSLRSSLLRAESEVSRLKTAALNKQGHYRV